MKGLTDKIRDILKKLEIKELPIPLEKVANLFSIKVIYYPSFPDHVSGIIINREGLLAIGINSDKPKVRQRFTLAHELGHFLLGHEIDEKIIEGIYDRPTDQEREANEFAAELLVPKDFLEKDIKEKLIVLKIPELARRYEVSEQAISVRLLETGLINQI
ncbi:hypothetical protein A2316_00480 [Candidatus Falkowbacteria bacterium RIFOXYB2_FULL_38_15]|uniref:IrrE N-terminal-like domain-containing protein n=1 Tax=Candidatus Falkowbacteria bacterium RIFOXYA2_FULL_38_12 TaxID=1797993 RepID=A0A1F5S1N0_9BACT|nr:MAG: hypothetical protein A2257_04435 [Candidatus Falkowbacteria bacterium RIFOXYA2_FULL_38_12]OGF32873.1 MAG: hypothetical protein A2316_00480 [Candidatus Falkowbacteria bacterium RIFOXYB2_FULL_38_15]OGF44009.1 MAG: hypothetical protein A2555_01210 [Candidatus Falkowbacteria bacterium RIFOXYD2_FULL_39_16]